LLFFGSLFVYRGVPFLLFLFVFRCFESILVFSGSFISCSDSQHSHLRLKALAPSFSPLRCGEENPAHPIFQPNSHAFVDSIYTQN